MSLRNPNPAFGAHLGAFAGIPTFMRQPAGRDLEGVDVAVVGIPFDSGANSYRSGARLGPRAIREASLLQWGHHNPFDISPLDRLTLVDYGDVEVEPMEIGATMQAIQQEVGAILSAGPAVLALGGDHSISLPLLRAHRARYGPMALIHFDAHSDTSDRLYDHGTPFRHAIKEGLIEAEATIQMGIRGPTFPGDRQKARDLGLQLLSIDECLALGMPAVVEAIHDTVGERPAYVSLDVDAADPAYAPGTGTPEVGGFTSYQLLQLVRGLRGLNLVGFDVVEVCPPYDAGNITAILAANLAFEFLTLLALRQA